MHEYFFWIWIRLNESRVLGNSAAIHEWLVLMKVMAAAYVLSVAAYSSRLKKSDLLKTHISW